MAGVPDVGESCELWVHTHVREDVLSLFGFATQAERKVFLLLLGVPQVGPKVALTALGGMPLPELVAAIAGAERGKLERVPGIGRKTAERILLDLKDKVVVAMGQEGAEEPGPGPRGGSPAAEQAREVLVQLGWKAREVDAALLRVSDGVSAELPLDEWVRRTLACLMDR
jgi:Holliday junction DNA helicase RuvA